MENQEQPIIQPQMPVQPTLEPNLASQGNALQNQTKKSLPKWPLIVVGVILLATLLTGTYLLGKNQGVSQKSASKTVQTPTTVPTPIIDTSTWKTYTSNNLGFSFKYPIDWREELATSDGPVYKYYNLTLKRDGYQINIKINLYGVGGATNRYVAKAEIANINNLASTTKAYINMNLASCTFDSQTSPSIPPSACTETFNEISVLNSNDIKNTEAKNSNVITTTREYPCFVDPTHRFEISLTTPAPINISDINSNAYISTYNQILSTFKFTDQTIQATSSPDEVANSFYQSYLTCINKHFQSQSSKSTKEDCPFSSYGALNANLITKLNVPGFADPVLCAQNTPSSISVEPAVINNDNTATEIVHELFSGSSDNSINVALSNQNGNWVIADIICPKP